jgi:hypothetical protein
MQVRFDPTTGRLMHLSSNGRGDGLVKGVDLRYHDKRATQWHGQNYIGEPASAITLAHLERSDDRVTVVQTSPHLRVTLTYRLPIDSPLLSVHVKVEGQDASDQPAELSYLGLPHVELHGSFNDAFEDPRDLFDDGGEVARGLELPCWRVFFRKGYRDGLMVATRSKAAMSRFNILARSFDVEPHAGFNYTSMPVVGRPPFVARPGAVCETSFEIGPWSAARHEQLLRDAKLTRPVKVEHPKPVGRFKLKLKGKVFYATKLAGTKASKTYSRKRWLLAAMPWTARGQALLAGTGVEAPMLRFDPKLRGMYRMFVGVGNGPGIALQLTGDSEWRYRIRHSLREDPTAPSFSLHLSGKHEAGELDFGVVKMDGRRVTIRQFPQRLMPTVLDYIRFEPLNQAAAARHARMLQREPILPLSGLTDTPDLSSLLDCRDPDPGVIDSVLWEHANQRVTKCHWRIDGQCADYPSRHNTMRYISAKVHGVFVPFSKGYGRLLKKVNVLQRAVDASKRYGVSLYGWMRFNNYSGNVASDFYKKNRQFWDFRENGAPAAKLCIAHPEVRRHKIDILLEAAAYGLDGLCIGILRHPPALEWAPVMMAAYEKEYGCPPPREAKSADPRFASSPVRMDGDYPRWWAFRARYMTTFGRELKAALQQAGLGHVKVALWLRPNHCLFDGIDLPTWLTEKLCDEVITQTYVGGNPNVALYTEDPQWKQMVQQHVPLTRAIWPSDEEIPLVKRVVAEKFDGLCTYESNDSVIDPRMIRLYESLRR